MKLYYHPNSATNRPIVLFALEIGIALELQVVDLFAGEYSLDHDTAAIAARIA